MNPRERAWRNGSRLCAGASLLAIQAREGIASKLAPAQSAAFPYPPEAAHGRMPR
ncbi:hypothetical protein [Azotobacter chroococcum]|uniref:hypothetical protein n=1 Tax=Azotobacter chroococcum TaxID=353 RepID=UPI000AC3177B|nr:hypothetical protein [Azotobacter chroococcum]